MIREIDDHIHDTTADISAPGLHHAAVSAPTPGVPYYEAEPPPLLDPSEFRFRSEFAHSIRGLNLNPGLGPPAGRFNAGYVSPKALPTGPAPSAESAPAETPQLIARPPPKTRPPQAPAESALTKAPPQKACVTAEHSAESWFAKAKAALAKAPPTVPTPAGCTCKACWIADLLEDYHRPMPGGPLVDRTKARPPRAPAESAPPRKACVTADHPHELWFAKAKAALAKAPPTAPAGCTCTVCIIAEGTADLLNLQARRATRESAEAPPAKAPQAPATNPDHSAESALATTDPTPVRCTCKAIATAKALDRLDREGCFGGPIADAERWEEHRWARAQRVREHRLNQPPAPK